MLTSCSYQGYWEVRLALPLSIYPGVSNSPIVYMVTSSSLYLLTTGLASGCRIWQPTPNLSASFRLCSSATKNAHAECHMKPAPDVHPPPLRLLQC